MTIYRLLIISLLACTCRQTWGALENRPLDARSLGMGQASVAVSDSVFTNPAGLVQLKRWEAGSGYSKLFNLDELAFSVLSVGGPVKNDIALGFGFSSFGGSRYQENLLLIGSGVTLRRRFHLGLNCRAAQIKIGQGKVNSGIGADGGLLIDVTSRLKAGYFHQGLIPAFNRDWTRSRKAYGLALQVTDNALLGAEILEETPFPPNWRVGQEIWISPLFALRCGFSVNPDRFSFGFGLKRDRLRVDYAVTSHEVLDLTHLITLNVVWGLL